MATKIRLLLAPLAVVLLLSACSVTVFIGALTDKTVSTSEYTGAVLADAPIADPSVTLDPGSQRIYRVDVTSSSLSALYLYMNAELDLYAYDTNGSIVATSASADFFAASFGGLANTSSAAALAPAGVTSALLCPGSCVIQASSIDSPIYVRVENSTSSAVTFDFFAVTRDFEDSSEATASDDPVTNASSVSGALETLGDVDRYEVQDGGVLNLAGTAFGGIIFEAEISDPVFGDNPTRTIRTGQSTSVDIGEIVRVYAVNAPDRAASAANSTYSLFYD